MDPKIDKLITDLRDSNPDVRREALDELSKLEDRKHAIPAIHWTMLNDVDDGIREYAREIYLRIGKQEKAKVKTGEEELSGREAKPGKEERRVHLKPTMGWPNPFGTWSIHFSLMSITLIIASSLIQILVGNEEIPFLIMLHYIGLGCTIPGLLLGIIGLVRARERKKSTPVWGLILNGSIILIGAWNLAMQLIS